MTVIPAPWSLRGSGYMLFYKFSRAFVEQHGFIPPELKGCFDGFFGSVMLVNYESSPAGPYRELLFIPGRFRTPQGLKYSITSIYVDSEASTSSGRANWGIPKHTKTFRVEQDGKTERIQVLNDAGTPFFDLTVRSGGWYFPVTTALIPFQLYQVWEGRSFLTKPSGYGWGQLARVSDIRVDPACFPDIELEKPLIAVKVSSFHMKFPQAHPVLR